MTAPPTPFAPPVHTIDLPGTGGTIGPEPEDFVVDEVPLYPFSGNGEHLYVRVKKRAMTTRDAALAVARAAGVREPDVGTAGMKDKHAVTTQWMSLPARGARPVEEWTLPENLSVVEATRHGNKLRTGHLAGNRFRIRLVGVEPGALERAERIAERLRSRGLPNYFGEQRFGRGGGNVARALAWIEAEARGERRHVKPFERKLFASVLQSEVFNRYAAARVELGLERPIEGEVVRLEGTGSMFAVEDPEREQPRWDSNDIHPTGPMIGPKMKTAHGRALELEETATAAAGLGAEARAALGKHANGTRRDVVLRLSDIGVTGDDGDRTNAHSSLVIELSLPSGGYATEVIREFSREPRRPHGSP
jgi:tRNA pseudouridine13 synthase